MGIRRLKNVDIKIQPKKTLLKYVFQLEKRLSGVMDILIDVNGDEGPNEFPHQIYSNSFFGHRSSIYEVECTDNIKSRTLSSELCRPTSEGRQAFAKLCVCARGGIAFFSLEKDEASLTLTTMHTHIKEVQKVFSFGLVQFDC
jgi:hypothetical protein